MCLIKVAWRLLRQHGASSNRRRRRRAAPLGGIPFRRAARPDLEGIRRAGSLLATWGVRFPGMTVVTEAAPDQDGGTADL
jgi:hypothetical protein